MKNRLFSLLISLFPAIIMLLSAAFYNGFPLVYSDSGTYLNSGSEFFVPDDRPITYGLLIHFFFDGFQHLGNPGFPGSIIGLSPLGVLGDMGKGNSKPQIAFLAQHFCVVYCLCPALVRRATHARHLCAHADSFNDFVIY